MVSDELDKLYEDVVQTNEESEELLKKIENEIQSVSQGREILNETIKQRSLEIGKEYNAEEKIPDYIGEAGKKVKELIEKGISKGKEWISRVRPALNKGIHTTIQTAPKVVQAVKEAPGKIDSKIQEKQMAHARDKFEKRKHRKTFSSKKEDLVNVIKFKINEWKEKGKDLFARNLETSKAYLGVAKDKVVETAKDAAFYTQYGAHNAKEAIKKAKDDTVFYAQYGAHNVKEGIKTAKDKVVETAKDAVFYTQYGAHNVKEGIKNTKDRVIKGVKGFVEKIDKSIQAKQMAHARDKFEKRKNRQTLSSKKEDLVNAIKFKINKWKEKGKESFARNLETSKAYMGIAKDKLKAGKDKVVKTAKQVGTEAKVLGAYGKVIADEKIDQAKNTIESAAMATSSATLETTDKIKRNVKKVSKKYTGTILRKMSNGLEKVIGSAQKLHESLKSRSNQLLETPNTQKEEKQQSTDEEVK